MSEFEVQYSEALIKKTTQRYTLRLVGRGGFITLGAILVCLLYLIAIGDRSWRIGSMATIAGFALVMLPSLYVAFLRRSLATFRAMDRPTAIFRLTDDTLYSKTTLGSSDIRWEAIEKVWKFPEVWLIFYSRGQYITLPTTALDAEACRFILEKVQRCGAQVS